MSKNKIYEITQFKQVIKIREDLTRSWFRGHPKTYNNLAPRIFRGIYRNEFYLKVRPEYEMFMIERFKQAAPVLKSNVPEKEDDLEWLILMQHHGALTRLLDWTENILIALYFAVKDYPKENGEIWALYPDELNKRSGIPGMPISKNSNLQYFVKEAYYSYSENAKLGLAKSLKLNDIPKYPIAFLPTWNFFRMLVQSSAFTIHPVPEKGNQIQDLLIGEKKFLVRYIIPAENKGFLLDNLNLFDIKHYRLFPNLDSLSKDIISELKYVGYNPPEPPKF